MSKYASLTFSEAEKPISNAITKFGGQPVWINQPEWPFSKKTQQPLRFICQIALDTHIFGENTAKMVYFFMGDAKQANGEFICSEHSVVVQPGKNTGLLRNEKEGPTLLSQNPDSHGNAEFVAKEYHVLPVLQDDTSILQKNIWKETVRTGKVNSISALLGNKIGGIPYFGSGNNLANDHNHDQLILQIDSTDVPFCFGLGGTGIGYIFLEANSKRGRFIYNQAIRPNFYDLILKGCREITLTELNEIQTVIKKYDITNRDDLEAALAKDICWLHKDHEGEKVEQQKCGKLIDLLIARKHLILDNQEQQRAKKCMACHGEIVPYHHSFKLCLNCTYQQIATEKITALIEYAGNQVADVIPCKNVFSGVATHLYPIIINQVAQFFHAPFTPIDKYPVVEPRGKE